jgi:hypothetical protein
MDIVEYQRPNPAGAAEVLHNAKAVLRTRGRGRGRDFLPDGKVCLHGAVVLAAGLAGPDGGSLPWDGVQRWHAYRDALRALNRTAYDTSDYGTSAIRLNDLASTTDERIYDLIDRTIAALPATETA